MYHLYYIVACLILFTSCGGDGKAKSNRGKMVSPDTVSSNFLPKYIKSVQIVFPQKNDTCRFNEQIKITFAHHKRYKIDSSHIFFNNMQIAKLDSNTFEYTYKIPKQKVGNGSVKVIAFHPGNKRGVATMPIVVKPDQAPQTLSYTLVKSFPHSTDAYTQGLVYHDEYLYEGTGQYGMSSLRKINLQQGKTLSVLNLDSDLFGEGVTIYKDKIYQLTWKSRKGFVYDLNTFSLETTFNYSTQGWGITTVEGYLIMSDGTHHLYQLNPATFDVIKTVEVYDSNGKIENLNELEYIDGLIWANVWLSDRIVLIDPITGVVKADLFLPDLLTSAEKAQLDENDDVLNGIAYNGQKGTVYVTGKRWPKLFELKIRDNH